jgi:hypothetical protein
MKNGTCWLDDAGEPIQAHGGCIMHHEVLYYWYGENKATETKNGSNVGKRVDYTQLLAMMNVRTDRAAQLFLGALPMMLVYPLLQKYFITGLVIGSIKG